MKYSGLLDELRQRRLFAAHVNAGDAFGTQLLVNTSLVTVLGHYLVYVDGRIHMVHTAAPDRWWAAPMAYGSYPTIHLIEHLAADLGATRLLGRELRMLQTYSYAVLVKERMQG